MLYLPYRTWNIRVHVYIVYLRTVSTIIQLYLVLSVSAGNPTEIQRPAAGNGQTTDTSEVADKPSTRQK